MATLVLASDAASVRDEIKSVLDAPATIVETSEGRKVIELVDEYSPDLVILDLQIGSMGGIAVSLDLRLEEGAGRLDYVPILLLLDRRADVFLAKRAGFEGWLIKPFDPVRLRQATRALLTGGIYHDTTLQPHPVRTGQPSDATR